LKSDIIMRVR